MRYLGIDVGRKRIGLALSDASGLVASPWVTVPAGETMAASVLRIRELVAQARDPLDDDSAVGAIIVGLPRRLNGTDNEQTADARTLAAALAALTGLEVVLQDERLTSREAEARLAEREPDWRRRKERIDAVAAAIILQDYLDHGRGRALPSGPGEAC